MHFKGILIPTLKSRYFEKLSIFISITRPKKLESNQWQYLNYNKKVSYFS